MLYLQSFPDIDWLKQRIRQNFAQSPEVSPDKGWPTVILHTNTKQASRPDIKGPFSIFLNLSGHSFCSANNHRVKVDDSTYFITNHAEHYSLEIDNPEFTQTFNLHFSEALIKDAFTSLCCKTESLLDSGIDHFIDTPCFFNRLTPKSARLKNHIHQLKALASKTGHQHPNPMLFESLLFDIVEDVFLDREELSRQFQNLSANKTTTKQEVGKRLLIALDYLHSYYNQAISLDELSQVAAMSKFHFLRSFKEMVGLTPHQYQTSLRLQQAKPLLKNVHYPIREIAQSLGFENASSFSRLFYQRHQMSPLQFRKTSR